MLHAIITTIQEPTESVRRLAARLSGIGGKLIVAGDSKGPRNFDGVPGEAWPVEFLSLADQERGGHSLAAGLPTGHYARKNIAYLHAIARGATCIYETDDDNMPNDRWFPREEVVSGVRGVGEAGARWVNVYQYFTDEKIWPRGLPLDEIRSNAPATAPFEGAIRAPVQQGLVDGSPDVDAIWRLVMDREFSFEDGGSVHLGPGNWCPINTQSTWWWPVAFPLLYIPSHCSFRMCDIWKGFIAQRCLWAMGLGIVFHGAEVVQDRNPHDLTRDFHDEISGYEGNRTIAGILADLELAGGEDEVAGNLRRCYVALIAGGFFPKKELALVDAWLVDLARSKR